MNNEKVQVAIVQYPSVFLNLGESVKKAIEYIEEAAGSGAKVIAFGETWLSGYPVWFDYAPDSAKWNDPGMNELFKLFSENAIEIDSEYCRSLLEAAVRNDAYVIMGANERDGNTIYNTIIYFDPEKMKISIHRKLVPTFTERLVWGRGDGSMLEAIDSRYGKLGALVCWEHWMPLTRAAMHAQKEKIHIAQWPGAHDLHQLCSRHYAFEGQCFVLACGTYLTKDDVMTGYESLGVTNDAVFRLLDSLPDDKPLINGGSSIIAPNTSYVTEPLIGENGIVIGEIDLSETVSGALTMDSDGHYSRPDIFELRVNAVRQTNVVFENKETGE